MERWIDSAMNGCFSSLLLHFNSTLIIIINECAIQSVHRYIKKPSDAYTRKHISFLAIAVAVPCKYLNITKRPC